MKTFKDFAYKKTKEGHLILQDPIHFKMGTSSIRKTKEGYVIIDEPLTIHSTKQIKESLQAAHEYNVEHHSDTHKLSDKLHKATADDLSDDDHDHIFNYTKSVDGDDDTVNGSTRLNLNLVNGTELSHRGQKMHSAIKRNSKASGHEFHLFSGTSRDFEHLNKHTKDGIFHSPAHISATHHVNTATEFAKTKHNRSRAELRMGKGEFLDHHLIHIHVKPHDKVLHVSKHSDSRLEHETIIPSGANLKYSHSSRADDYHLDGKFKVHHFTIHSQE